jgi:hypothetical protein
VARDENDRPYEDGQGRPLNPELMTGDVLSPRWSTEDTDEQPAIQVVGNETYILPLDKGSQPIDGPRDVLDDPPPRGLLAPDPHDVLGGPHDVLDGPGGSRDALGGASGPHDVLGASGGYDLGGPSGAHDFGGPSGAHDFGGPSGAHDFGGPSGAHDLDDEHSGPHRVDSDNPYLPLDRGYDGDRDDDADDRPKRGFLGSGWTDDADGKDSYGGRAKGEGEVRRRTRVLLVAAVAVVIVGVGAGWMLTGTSSDDPCAGAQCASAGEVNTPSESALPEEEPIEDETEEPVDEEPVDTTTDEPDQPRASVPATPQQRVRQPATREPSARPTATREPKPTTKATSKPTREPQGQMNETDDRGNGRGDGVETETSDKQSDNDSQTPTETDSGTTQAPVPQPTQEERKGLLDILFPWA